MGDLPFMMYFDLETTCGRKLFEHALDPVRTMYPVSYCFIVAFNPSLHLNKITELRSFNDSAEQLADVSYLTNEIIVYRDHMTTKQLIGCVQDVAVKKNYSLIEMLCCELKFVIDVCKNGHMKSYEKKI